MKEELTAGFKEFLIVVIGAAVLYVVCGVMMSLFGEYAFVGGIISVLIFCVFGFFVLTRYTARFTYSLNGSKLRINRMIGKRNKEIEIDLNDAKGVFRGHKSAHCPKKVYYMRKSILKNDRSLYIEFTNKDGEDCCVVIEPSQKLEKKIGKLTR